MATYISKATGNFTSTSTWAPISSVSLGELDSEAGSTAGTTSFVLSASFTPAATAIDGIAVKVSNRVASPTGTITITLANQTAAGTREQTTTLNVTDIDPLNASTTGIGWYFFKFSSTVTPNGTDVYKVGFKTSVAGEATLYRDATAGNWSRMIRLTSAASAPAALDKFVMIGEYTAGSPDVLTSFVVTMDNTTTTSFGPVASGGPPQGMFIGKGGTMTYGVVASTAYVLRLKGKLYVASGGTLNIGTSGARMPSTSSGILEFDSVANNDSALNAFGGGIVNVYGNNISNVSALLTANAAAAATSLTTNISTGWKNGDVIALAATNRTLAESESVTMGADASGTSLPTVGALGFAHSGTSPTQAEVINLTRNVKIRGVSATFYANVIFRETAAVHVEYCEFQNLGTASGTGGITAFTTTGSCSITFCSLHDSTVSTSSPEAFSTSGAAHTGIVFSNNVLYNNYGGVTFTSTTGISVIDSNISIKGGFGSAGKFGFTINVQFLGSGSCTFTNNTAVSAFGLGISMNQGGFAFLPFVGTCSGNTVHTCGGGAQFTLYGGTVSNTKVWRCTTSVNTGGFVVGSLCVDMIVDGFTLFGNSNNNMGFLNGSNGFYNCTFRNGTIAADTTFATTNGIMLNVSPSMALGIRFENCTFGTATGIFANHTNDIQIADVEPVTFTMVNCKLDSPVQVLNQTNLNIGGFIKLQSLTTMAHKTWTKYGTIASETSTVNLGGASVSLTPLNATTKLVSPSFYGAVRSGSVLYPTVFIQKSASYNGNQPRLILKKNDGLGITSDTVIATYSAGTGSWNMIGGVTASASIDGVMEFVVDCDGTAGVVYVDTFNIV